LHKVPWNGSSLIKASLFANGRGFVLVLVLILDMPLRIAFENEDDDENAIISSWR
jgi:hypothetical protein